MFMFLKYETGLESIIESYLNKPLYHGASSWTYNTLPFAFQKYQLF